jgi:Tfp pilus assembly PilM family ATPase
MRTVTIRIPVPSALIKLFGMPQALVSWASGRRSDETPREIDFSRFKVDDCFRIPFELLDPLATPAEIIGPDEIIGNGIKTLVEKLKGDSKTPIATLLPPQRDSIMKVSQPPVCTLKQLRAIIAYEEKQQIELDPKKATTRSLFAGDIVIEGEHVTAAKVIFIGANTASVARTQDRFGALKSRVDLVTTGSLITAELGRTLLQRGVDEALCLVDIHAGQTELVIVHRGDLWTKTIEIGGDHFTMEQHKALQGCAAGGSEDTQAPAPYGDEPVADRLIQGLARSIAFWKMVNRQTVCSRLYMTGGPAKHPGLARYVGDGLGFTGATTASPQFEIDGIGRGESEEFSAPILLAIQRLGYGYFRTNLLAKSSVFGPKAESALGVTVGTTGICVARVSLKK